MAAAAPNDGVAPPDHDVFISYSRRDGERVLRLVESLRAKGVTVWMDQGGIEGAARWSQEIVEAITRARVFLFVASAKSFESDNVAKELSIASEEKKSILPVYLEPVSVPSSIRYQLAGIQHVELYGRNEARAFEAILRAIGQHGSAVSGRGAGRRMPVPRAKALVAGAVGACVLAAIAGIGRVFAWPSRSPSIHVALPATLAAMGSKAVRLVRATPTGEEVVAESRLGSDDASVVFRGEGFDEGAFREWLQTRGSAQPDLRGIAIGGAVRVREGDALRADVIRIDGNPPAPVIDAATRAPMVIASVELAITNERFQSTTAEDKTR